MVVVAPHFQHKMESTITTTDLAKTVKESNLPVSKAEALEAAFMPFYEQVAKHCETAFQIKVTNLAQTAEMGKARRERLALKEIRISKEKIRKQVKEDALREGKAIDKIANFLDSVIEPMEKYLQDQEDFGKRLQERAQAEARDLRMCEAGKLLEFFPESIDLGLIGDEEYAKLLNYATAQWNAREAAEKAIEKERIEREQREAAEKEALRVENERLKAEAARVEAQRQKEREAVQKSEAEYNAKLAEERAHVYRLRLEAEAKERAENQRIEADARAKADAEKAAKEAPDKQKLVSYAKVLWGIPQPQFATEQAAEKFGRAAQKIAEAIKILQS